MKHLLILLATFNFSLASYAQTGEEVVLQDTAKEEKKRVEFHLQLKNMHYWRGFAVTTSPLLASNLYYQSPNGQWQAGFWGGMGYDGNYREFDYYIAFSKGPFSASLWDIYNFSSPEIAGRGFFDYNNRTTGRFLDLTVGYNFEKYLPLKVSASTILYGRDSEIIEDPNVIERTGRLRYTSYVEARYTILKKETYELQGFIGGAIALRGTEDTFYTSRNGINFIGLQYHKVVKIGEYSIPVQATPAWNPNADHAYMEVAISFF